MAIETSMYAAPPQGNNLVDMLRLFSALGNNTNDPNQNRLMGTSGGGSYAGAGGTSGAMYASVPKDRGPVAATVADELRANGLSDNGIRGVLANVQELVVGQTLLQSNRSTLSHLRIKARPFYKTK